MTKRFYYFILFYLFIFGCVGSSLLPASFLQLQRAGATLCCGAQASHCSGFSCCRAWAVDTWALVVAARRLSSCGSWALEHRLSSCGTRAQLLCGMWDLPGPGIKPMCLALAGGFLTTALPEKTQQRDFKIGKIKQLEYPSRLSNIQIIGVLGRGKGETEER